MISQLSKMKVRTQVRKRRHTSIPSGMENIQEVERNNGHYMTRSKLESSMPILDQYQDDPKKAKRACTKTNDDVELGKKKNKRAKKANLPSNDEKVTSMPLQNKSTENDAWKDECILCKETFTDKSKFTVHLKKHHPVGDNRCRICQQVLSSPSSLDRHILTHSKERPYNCEYCDQSFTTNGNMNRHKHKHESKNPPPVKNVKNSNSSVNTGKMAQVRPTIAVDEPIPQGAALDEACTSNDETEVEMTDSTSSTEVSAKVTTDNQLNGACSSSPEETKFVDLSFLPFSSKKFSLVAQKKYEKPTRLPIDAFHGCCDFCGELYSEDISHTKTYLFHECLCSITFKTQLEYDHHMAERHLITNHEKKCEQGNIFRSLGLCLKKQNGSADKAVSPIRCTSKEDESTTSAESQVMLNNSNLEMSQVQTNEVKRKNTDLQCNGSNEVEVTETVRHLDEDNCASELPVLSSTEISKCTENSNDFADIKSILSNVSVSPVSSEQSDGDSPKSEDSKNDEVSSRDGNTETEPSKGADACRKKDQLKNKPEYSCTEEGCPYKSSDKSSIRRHLRTHTKEHPFVCIECSQKFTTKANGERHAKKKHGMKPPELSEAITYTGDPSDTSEPRICKYCGKDFFNYRVLAHHYRSTKNSCSQKPFQCAVCGQSFSNKHNYKRHYRKKHNDDNLTETEKLERMRADCISSTNKMPIRKKHAAGGTVKNSNSKIVEDQNIDTNSSEASNASLEVMQSSFSDDDRVDAAQSLVTLSQSRELEPLPLDLSLHALDLSPNKPCRSIGPNERSASIQSSNSSSLANSILEISPGLGRIPSNTSPDDFSSIPLDLTCNQLNTSSSILVANLIVPQGTPPSASQRARKVKDNKDRIKCEYCSSDFTLKTNKERHVKNIHPECWRSRGRRISSGSMRRNITHKGGIQIPPTTKKALLTRVLQNADNKQQLDLDGSSNRELHNKQVVKNEAMENLHEMEVNSDLENVDLASVSSVIHTANSPHFNQYLTEDMSCNMLDKNVPLVPNNEAFNSNNRGKSKENKYECHECGRAFQWTSSLQRHTVIHTGVKPFVCEECNQRCTTKSNLARHYKNIHGEAAPSVQKNAFQVHNGHNNGELLFGSPIKTESNDTNETSVLKTGKHLGNREIHPGTMSHLEVPDFECGYCNTSYKCEGDLTNHTKELHPLEYANLQGKDIDFAVTSSFWKKN